MLSTQSTQQVERHITIGNQTAAQQRDSVQDVYGANARVIRISSQSRSLSCPAGMIGSIYETREVRTDGNGLVTYGSWSTDSYDCESPPVAPFVPNVTPWVPNVTPNTTPQNPGSSSTSTAYTEYNTRACPAPLTGSIIESQAVSVVNGVASYSGWITIGGGCSGPDEPVFATAPPVMGGALMCNQLGCLMSNGQVMSANGQNVGSFSTNAQGNFVANIGNAGSVTFDAGGGGSFNSSTGAWQSTNNVGGVLSCSDDVSCLALNNTNNITVTNNANGQFISTASGGSLNVATGQVVNSAGQVIGSGSIDASGVNVSLINGQTGSINFGSSTSNGQIISSVGGFSGSGADTLNAATIVNSYAPPPSIWDAPAPPAWVPPPAPVFQPAPQFVYVPEPEPIQRFTPGGRWNDE